MRRSKSFCLIFSALALMEIACNHSAQSYLDRGNRFFAEHKYADAAVQYQKATQKAPNWGEPYYRWGLAELHRSQGPAAMSALSTAVRLIPDHQPAKAQLADLYLNAFLVNPLGSRSLYDGAVKLSDELLAKDGSSFDGLRLKGALALIGEKPSDAREFLRRANEVKPMQRDVVLPLTQALFQTGQAIEGEKLARQLIAQEKDFGPIYDALYQQFIAGKRDADAEQILQDKVRNNPKVAAYRLDLAGHYALRQKSGEMTAVLQGILNDPREFPQGRLLVGNFYAALGDWGQALAYYEEGARSTPGQRRAYEQRSASALIALGKRDDALALLEKLVKENSSDLEGRSLQASLWLQSGQPQQEQSGIQAYEALVKEKPDDPQLHYELGRAYLIVGQPEPARPQLLAAVGRRKDFVPAQLLLAGLSLNQGNGEDAVRVADEILALHPGHPGASLLRAAGLVLLKRYPEARAELNHLARAFPEEPQVQLEWGVLALAEENFAEAERIFSRLLGSSADSRSATGLLEVYSAQNRYETALQLVSKKLQQSPDSIVLRRLVAIASARAGRFEQAAAEYEKLLQRDPASVETRLRLGDAYRGSGAFDKAMEQFRETMRYAPENTDAATLLAETLAMTGRREEAKALYLKILKLHPDNPAVMNNVAYLTCEIGGELGEALTLAQKAVQRAPKRSDFLDTLGWVYLKQKKTDIALGVFERLVRENPKNSTFRYHAGLTLLAKGDSGRAAAELQAALGNRPGRDEEREIREVLGRINR